MAKFQVKDAFKITGRGIVLAGTVLEGEIYLGDKLFTDDEEEKELTVTGIEKFVNRLGKPASKGENVGLLVRELKETNEIDSGTILKHSEYSL